MSKYTYAVLGAGRQGTAAAYDLAKFGAGKRVLTGGLFRKKLPQRSAQRINQLIGREVAPGSGWMSATGLPWTVFLPGVDVTLSAVPYYFNLEITKACLAAGSQHVRYGRTYRCSPPAACLGWRSQESRISIVPDCGMGPGLNVTMAMYANGPS